MSEKERKELIDKIMLRSLKWAYRSPEDYAKEFEVLRALSDTTLVFIHVV